MPSPDDAAVGRWPFPAGVSTDQHCHGSSFRRSALTAPVASTSKTPRRKARQVWCGPCRASHRSDRRFRAPLLGFLKDRPSVVLLVCPLLASQGSEMPIPNSFRSCRSSRLQRFPPHKALRVCCTPQTTMGFTWFPADCRPATPKRDRRTPDLSHRCCALRSFSLSGSGFPVTRALPPRCWLSDHRSDRIAPTSGLSSTEESVAPRRCCHQRLARYSLGLPTISGSHRGFRIDSLALLTTEVMTCLATEVAVRRGGLPEHPVARGTVAVETMTAFPRSRGLTPHPTPKRRSRRPEGHPRFRGLSPEPGSREAACCPLARTASHR